MGQCASLIDDCLGRRKEDPEHASLLHDPNYPHHPNGTFDHPGGPVYPGRGSNGDIDVDRGREREALERIVQNASMNLIDIFALQHQQAAAQAAAAAAAAASAHHHHHHPRKSSQSSTAASNPSTPALKREASTSSQYHPDAKRMAMYRALLQRTSPPVIPVMPEVLDPSVVSDEERAWLEGIAREAEKAVEGATRVKGVGKVVVGLEFTD